ncbi:dUTP diphosphatase [Alkalispirochaeta americana]|uniref:dUTP diphosphatase n=1 Tax=Alkalispirochaeta americana TaxID=159291 RepID=UPI00097141DB|nr:dUTP diphosphatase [Alkalispirochaeta americana]
MRCTAHRGCLPEYASPGAAGADLRASLSEPVLLQPGERSMVPTGVRLEIPRGFEGQVRPRSGLAARQGITVINAPGTIDCDYRGEVMVPLVNLSDQEFRIEPGDRIAQLVLAPVVQAEFIVAEDLSETGRGSGGFGSTGAR